IIIFNTYLNKLYEFSSANRYFSNGFTDTDNVVPFGYVYNIFATGLLHLNICYFDAYYAVYLKPATCRGVKNLYTIINGDNFYCKWSCLFFYDVRRRVCLLCMQGKRRSNI
ncbi:MAG: hypothetical protein LBL79_00420, partial [Prevotella sp.]|nr:hypothetical protein [Prevotella sp.]